MWCVIFPLLSLKISELYEIVKKWDSLSDTLPNIVDRLSSLNQLHEQGAMLSPETRSEALLCVSVSALQFSQALAHLDTSQQNIAEHLQSHGDMLKQVRHPLMRKFPEVIFDISILSPLLQVQSTLSENLTTIKKNCEAIDSRVNALSKK